MKLGDAVAAVTSAVGIKPCDACKRRQVMLNTLGDRLGAILGSSKIHPQGGVQDPPRPDGENPDPPGRARGVQGRPGASQWGGSGEGTPRQSSARDPWDVGQTPTPDRSSR